MKKVFLTVALLLASAVVSAQYYKDAHNVDMLHVRQPRTQCRTELRMPDVDGYKAIKADLHTHTVFSDGGMNMESRVKEAWFDGLDVMAVTEHLEYRPSEKQWVKYLKGYTDGAEASDYSFVSENRPASAANIKADLNYPVEVARKEASKYGITIIPGIEITRKEGEYCHFNALFTTDNNAIYAPETIESVRNAKKQGALVMHNHPGWKHKDLNLTEYEKMIYKENLIDGIEIMNGAEFYPKAIDRAIKHNLFMAACTDIHYITSTSYANFGVLRNMTIIFAKDSSLESLREALDAKRTIAYSYGVLAGSEELLSKFVSACITCEFMTLDYKQRPIYKLTNNSSVEYCFSADGHNLVNLPANSSITVRVDKKGASLNLVFENVWCSSNKFLTLTVTPK